MSVESNTNKSLNRFEVEISIIPNYTYQKPLVYIDDNGEPQVKYRDNGKRITFKKLSLLYVAEYDDTNKLISYTSLDEVNEFLMAKTLMMVYLS